MKYHDSDPILEEDFESVYESAKRAEADAVEEAVQIISAAIHEGG